MSDILEQTRRYEFSEGRKVPWEARPAFHLSAAVGWLNDPNGFSHYNGAYHLFYQSNPYDTRWGRIHWSHARSDDLLHWEYLPTALAPDQPYDASGCFSGSAVTLPDGRQMLMYTSVGPAVRPDGAIVQVQTQSIAIGDGVNYEKCPENPVITAADLPPGAKDTDFRDPKLWMEPDGSFRVVIASDRGDGTGQVLLYGSQDARRWTLLSVLDHSDRQLGRMWECPDFFPLDGRQVLIVSPMDMEPLGPGSHPGHTTVALLGHFDGRAFHRESVQELNAGLDFYAPQTMCAPDGRRILVAWMQNWASSTFVPRGARYFGQMTLPRELRVEDGWLMQSPIRELERCRCRPVRYTQVALGAETELGGVRGTVVDLNVHLRAASGCSSVTIALRKGGIHETTLTWLPGRNVLYLDRSRSGYLFDICHTRTIPVVCRDGQLDLRLILDRFSLEFFVDGGRQAASTVLFTPQEADRIVFRAEGPAYMDIEKFDLDV